MAKTKISKKFLDNTMNPLGLKSCALKEHFTWEDFQTGEKNIFVLKNALVRVSRSLYYISNIQSTVVQCPVKSNDWSATIQYQCSVSPKLNEFIAHVSACADCRSSNAGEGFCNYTVAMAESRAESRALRSLLGIDVCSDEEVIESTKVIDEMDDSPIDDQQLVLLQKKYIKSGKKTLSDISNLIERKVSKLEDLSRKEALQVIKTIGK